MNPYPCENPAAQCGAWPGVTLLNQALGCVILTSTNTCTPNACPAIPCGAYCPGTCPHDTLGACKAYWASETEWKSDCVAHLREVMTLVSKETLPGCEDGEEKAGVCTVAYSPAALTQNWTWAPNNGPAGEHLGNPVLAYQNFFNEMEYCITRTCSCPTQPLSDGTSQICSGHGECQGNIDESGNKTFACACAYPYTGASCSVKAESSVCSMGWNPATQTVETCSGAARGTCVDGKCGCFPGYSGDACQFRTCPTVNGAPCAGNGTCSLESICICDEGYSGEACNCTQDQATGKTVCKGTVGNAATKPVKEPEGPTTPPAKGDKDTFRYVLIFGIVTLAILGGLYIWFSGRASKAKKEDAVTVRAINALIAARSRQQQQ